MTVSYTSYSALAISYGIEMLAASSTFQGLVGVITSAAAKGAIIESVGGIGATQDQGVTVGGGVITVGTANFAVVHEDSFESTEIALRTFGYSGTINVDLLMPLNALDTAPEMMRRMRNQAGGIKADMEARFGQSGYLLRGHITEHDYRILDETSDFKGYAVATLSINWSSP